MNHWALLRCRRLVLGGCFALSLVLSAALMSGVGHAEDATNASAATAQHIYLSDNNGALIQIATLSVDVQGTYEITFDATSFTDHFLSMRPFKCIEGPDKHWCHVPYPYEIKRNIATDLIDLEYDLLFLWKGATDYGIDTWNGIYYMLETRDDGIHGTAHEIDLGGLAVPPPPGDLRPVRAADLHETEADSHWLPHVVIR